MSEFGALRPLHHLDFISPSLPPALDPERIMAESMDSAIETALRRVPLPSGFLARLGTLVHTMPDDMRDQVDWLGC